MPATFLYEARTLEVLSVSPPSGPVAGGTAVAILGRNFQGAAPGSTTVTFGGVAATSVVVDSNEHLSCVTPAHAAGLVDVVVTNSDAATATYASGFAYETTPPTAGISYRTPSGAAAPGNVRLTNPPPSISQTIGQPWTATFTTSLEPKGFSGVTFKAFGETLFEGIITSRVGRSEGRAKRPVWDATATNYVYLLSRRYPIGAWEAVSATTVLQALMSGYGSGFSSAGVEAGLGDVSVEFDGSTDLWSAITQVCEACGAKCFLAGTTLHVFTVSSSYDPPAAVTASNPDLLYPSNAQAVTIEYDYTQIRNRVTVRGAEGLSVTLDDPTSVSLFGVCEFPINDNTLTTLEALTTRAQVELTAYAQPIPTIRYATRDLKTMAGKTVSVTLTSPAISGTFVIQSVQIDQLELLESGAKPRFTVTAAPATAPMHRAAGGVGLLQTVVDLASTAKKDPPVPSSIPVANIAGCIPSTKLVPTGVTAGPYGGPASLVEFTVNEAGQLTIAATDPVPVVKTDGSQAWTADQSMGGNTIEDVAPPVNGTDAVNKDYVDDAIDAAVGGGLATVVRGEVPTGAVDGSNAVYTTAADYANLAVYLNGVRQKLTDHYTETTADTFTFTSAPLTGDIVTVDYNDQDASPSSSGGAVVQVVTTQTGAVATGSTVIPLDNTIPQNTEGTEFVTRTITPTDAAHVLQIDVVGFFTSSAVNWITVALFQDSVANALAAWSNYQQTAGGGNHAVFRHTMAAGTTSAITFKVRAGPNSAATVTFNGGAGAGYFGGVIASSLTVTELVP